MVQRGELTDTFRLPKKVTFLDLFFAVGVKSEQVFLAGGRKPKLNAGILHSVQDDDFDGNGGSSNDDSKERYLK